MVINVVILPSKYQWYCYSPLSSRDWTL